MNIKIKRRFDKILGICNFCFHFIHPDFDVRTFHLRFTQRVLLLFLKELSQQEENTSGACHAEFNYHSSVSKNHYIKLGMNVKNSKTFMYNLVCCFKVSHAQSKTNDLTYS